jgi:hypothetical protein
VEGLQVKPALVRKELVQTGMPTCASQIDSSTTFKNIPIA